MLFLLGILAIVAFLFYLFLTWTYDYWTKRGVSSPEAKLFVGSFPNLIRQKQHFAEDFNVIYKQYKATDNYVGIFLMRQPILMILAPKLVHEILVTSFKHFHDNDAAKLLDANKDPLLAKNPFLQTGQQWKAQRALISTGLAKARVKVAYSLMQKVCHEMCAYIKNELKLPHEDGIDSKDLALRFTCENVCDSVLGIEAKSFTSNPIPIVENVKKYAENNSSFLICTLLWGLVPSIIKFYKAKFIPKSAEDFFFDLIQSAFKTRLASRNERFDFLNHVLSLKQKQRLSDLEIASHTMTFLIDGLETSATVISHCLLLLARNVEIQKRLRQEILENLAENGELTFEKLNEMPYLDACLHESMRIFTPGLFSTKTCTQPIEFTNKNGEKLRMRVGETVLLPLYALHRDAEFFLNPEIFDPQRYLSANDAVKKYRDSGLFLPFGDGPRMCIGMRFALTQTKAAIAAIIQHFDVKVNKRTKADSRLDPKAFLALQDGGVWLDFKKVTEEKINN